MKIRAAVLEQFGSPLVVQEIDLAEPKAGEVLVRLAACGVCHTDLYTASGRRPDRLRAVRARPRRRRRRRARRRRRHPRRARRPRDHAVRARVREVHPLPQRPHQPLHRDPRPAGPRLPPRRHRAALARRRAAAALHGHLDVRGVHRDAGDRAREGEPGGAARRLRAVCLRPLDRDRRRALHGQGRAGLDVRRLRLRPRRPRRRDRLPARGRRADHRRRPLRGPARSGTPSRRDRDARRRRGHGRLDQAPRPAASAPTTPSRRPGSSR